MSNLHRKNAAEWVMYIVIYPFAWVKYRLGEIRNSKAEIRKKFEG
jgi:hypothetical protein